MKTPITLLFRWPAILTITALLTLFTVIPAFGQATENPPGQMTFQGFLTDASTPPVALGNTAPENKTVTFKIYKSAQGTAAADVLWAEQQVVTIDKGHFSVLLGEGSAVSGSPHDSDLSGVFTGIDASDRWIGITVDGGEITPRIRFFPAPYAQLARRARVADSANSLVNSGGTTAVVNTQAGRLEVAGELSLNPGPLTLTGNATISGNVGIGNTAPGSLLDVGPGPHWRPLTVRGSEGTDAIVMGNLTGKATIAGHTSTLDGWADLILSPGGNVGVGTSAPTQKLDVNGNISATGQVISSGSVAGLVFQNRDADLQWQWYSLGSTARLWNSSAGDRVTVTQDGKVGIRVPAPTHHLTINGSTGIIGGNVIEFGAGVAGKEGSAGMIGYQTFGAGALDIVGAGTAFPRKIQMFDWVGIGAVPTFPLHVLGAGTDVIGTHASFVSTGGGGANPGTFTLGDVSIKSQLAVHALYFRAVSDARIKNIQGRSVGSSDLETLKRIEITDYQYKDFIAKGNRSHKKVIGQQVEQVFPQAVVKSVDVVPDIYQKVPTKDGWVDLATNLKKGDRVRLISKTQDGIREVLEVTPDRFRTEFIPKEDAVFVFGREVNDFRVVDYEAIAMLNVSATQELARQVEALRKSEARIAELEQKTSRMAELELKAARVDSLEREMAELKKLVAGLARGQTSGRLAALNVPVAGQ